MSARFWIDRLPSTDPAFASLHRAAEMSPEDWPALERAHRQARSEAAWGKSLDAMEEAAETLHDLAVRLAERDDDGSDKAAVHAAELVALGYALGLTAVRVAIRTHDGVAGTGRAA